MECFACIQVCPTDALEIDKSVSCVRLERRPPLRVDDKKCDKCNQCNEVCPMGDTALSAKGCTFCIICKGRPDCLLFDSGRASFLNFITSIARVMVLMEKFIF